MDVWRSLALATITGFFFLLAGAWRSEAPQIFAVGTRG
jgi:hypothetical protein